MLTSSLLFIHFEVYSIFIQCKTGQNLKGGVESWELIEI